jgi:hypothetical protein
MKCQACGQAPATGWDDRNRAVCGKRAHRASSRKQRREVRAIQTELRYAESEGSTAQRKSFTDAIQNLFRDRFVRLRARLDSLTGRG